MHIKHLVLRALGPVVLDRLMDVGVLKSEGRINGKMPKIGLSKRGAHLYGPDQTQYMHKGGGVGGFRPPPPSRRKMYWVGEERKKKEKGKIRQKIEKGEK